MSNRQAQARAAVHRRSREAAEEQAFLERNAPAIARARADYAASREWANDSDANYVLAELANAIATGGDIPLGNNVVAAVAGAGRGWDEYEDRLAYEDEVSRLRMEQGVNAGAAALGYGEGDGFAPADGGEGTLGALGVGALQAGRAAAPYASKALRYLDEAYELDPNAMSIGGLGGIKKRRPRDSVDLEPSLDDEADNLALLEEIEDRRRAIGPFSGPFKKPPRRAPGDDPIEYDDLDDLPRARERVGEQLGRLRSAEIVNEMVRNAKARRNARDQSRARFTKGGKDVKQQGSAERPKRERDSYDYLVSRIDGKRRKKLSRHLREHGLTPQQYREKFGLGDDYPMDAQSVREKNIRLARANAVGDRARRRREGR